MTDPFDAVPAETALRAGAAPYNVGDYPAAREAWAAADGEESDALFDALAALADAITRGQRGEWTAATTAADRAVDRFAEVKEDAGGVAIAPLQRWLAAFRADPERIERGPAPPVVVDGDRTAPGTLSLSPAGVAAAAVAEVRGHEADIVADAVRFARQAEHPEGSNYATFLRDFVGDPARRPIIFQRLSETVERERRKERDVGGLFDESDEN